MIKIRSWDPKTNTFTFFVDGVYKNNMEQSLSDSINAEIVFNWKTAEQSTDLYDKNGVEIFENDNILLTYGDQKIPIIVLNHNLLFTLYNLNKELTLSFMNYHITLKDVEVLGNIHEDK